MEPTLFRVTTTPNLSTSDEQFVHECMTRVQARHPAIDRWTFDRVDERTIDIMMWDSASM